MKNTFKLIILILIISVYASCVKTNETSDNYVRITFSGKTLEDAEINILYYPKAYISTSNNTTNGGVTTTLWINNTLINTGFLHKDGNALGIYYADQFSDGYVIDKSVGNKRYDIDSGAVFTVTKIDASIVEGNFTCKLIDGSTKIPATGSFSLQHN